MAVIPTTKLDADHNINAVRPESATPRKVLAVATHVIRKLVGGDRFHHLTVALGNTLAKVDQMLGKKVRLLDYGCGNLAVGKCMHDKGLTEEVVCVDTYDMAGDPGYAGVKYCKIDGQKLEFADREFDAALIIDVLHHAGIENAVQILREVARCSQYIIVKDHVEYGVFSRQVLRLSDWFGNAAYGVAIPKRYFDQKSWQDIVMRAGLKEVELTIGVKIYDGLFGAIMPPHYHFLSILTAK